MSDIKRARHLTDPRFLFHHGLSRRKVLQLGAAAGGAAIVSGTPHLLGPGAVSAQDEEIVGGPIEVGVFQEEGPQFESIEVVGASLEADYPGTEVTYTFANTASDSARALRWQNGDPLDVDTARWSNQAPTTWDWPDNGFLLDLAPYVEQPLESGEIWADTFTEGAKSFTIDTREGTETPGAWWGVPYEMVLMLMQYNVRMFDEMGLTPPTTWEEFLAVCEAINEQGADQGIKPICVSGPTDVYCGHWWDRMTQRVVGREAVENVVFGDGRLADNPGFLTAAQEIAKIVDNDWLMEGYEGADFTTAQALFFQGRAAMIHMGTWLSSEMFEVIPEDYQLGAFDFPTYEGGEGNQDAMFGTAQIWSIPNPEISTSHEVNVPLAVEYLRRLTSRERSAERAELLEEIPAVTEVPPPPGVVGMDAMVEKSATSETIIYYYGIHFDTALWAAWYQPVQALFLKSIGPEQMIEQIDSNLDEYRELQAAGE